MPRSLDSACCHAGLSAAGYAIYGLLAVGLRNPWMLSIQVFSTITAALYLTATIRCEANPAHTGDDSGRDAGPDAVTVPGSADATLGAAAPKVPSWGISNPWGGSSTTGASKSSSEAAALFEGGSLFPGGSSASYGGFRTAKPEENPFIIRKGEGGGADT